jgi:hypothetical protein
MHLYGLSTDRKNTLAEEYRQIGFHVEVTAEKLTVFTLPPKKVKPKKVEKKRFNNEDDDRPVRKNTR